MTPNNSFLLTVAIIVSYCTIVQAQYEDVRCKCVCPSTTTTRGIFVRSFNEPGNCKCENVVDESVQATQHNFCDRCECQWQRRNTTTIKVVVILIICIVSLLFLYMLFLLCLDPLMSRRPKSYLEHQNEEDTQSVHRIIDDETSGQRPGALLSRVRHSVSRVTGEQKKWKGTVQEQRRNIYDRHTMLN